MRHANLLELRSLGWPVAVACTSSAAAPRGQLTAQSGTGAHRMQSSSRASASRSRSATSCSRISAAEAAQRERLVALVEALQLVRGGRDGEAHAVVPAAASSSRRIGTPTVHEWMPITLASSITSMISSRVAP